MIIKVLRVKKKDFENLVHYIDSDKGRANDTSPFDQHFAVFHNVASPTIEGTIDALKVNDTYRKQRKKSVVLYHEVMSFSPKDRDKITQAMIEDLAYYYIERRGPNAICFAKPHVHDSHIHVHFLFSGTEYRSDKTLRMDNKEFKATKKDMEAYQKLKYPELIHSIAYDKVRGKSSDKAYQTAQRLAKEGKKSEKKLTIELLEKALKQSTSYESFFREIHDKGVKAYARKGKPTGVFVGKRKYRFSSLLNKDWDKSFRQVAQRQKDLEDIRKNRTIPERLRDL